MFFTSSSNFFSLLRYLDFCPDTFGDLQKGVDEKLKVNFKNNDVITWEAIKIQIMPRM